MNRREFVKYTVAFTSLLALPTWAVPLGHEPPDKAEDIPVKITRLRVGSFGTKALREQNRLDHLSGRDGASLKTLPDDEYNYWAEAIEAGDKFYYRVNGTTVAITEYEFGMVVCNPNLYYFSMALRLHNRIRQAKAGEPITI